VLIELFSLGVTAEALRANIDWKSAFEIPKFPTIFLVKKLNESAFYRVYKFWHTCFYFFPIHAFDRQTDGETYSVRTCRSWLRPSCMKAVIDMPIPSPENTRGYCRDSFCTPLSFQMASRLLSNQAKRQISSPLLIMRSCVLFCRPICDSPIGLKSQWLTRIHKVWNS